MQVRNETVLQYKPSQVYVPDKTEVEAALKRTTHLGIGTHQDDIAIMAFHGVTECYGEEDKWFTGVTVTNGGGAPNTGEFSCCTKAEMIAVRSVEEKRAAYHGKYSAVVLLGYESDALKNHPMEIME